MKTEQFTIKAYGRTELALKYFPTLTKRAAWKKLKAWIRLNPTLHMLIQAKQQKGSPRSFTPKEVESIVAEIGEP